MFIACINNNFDIVKWIFEYHHSFHEEGSGCGDGDHGNHYHDHDHDTVNNQCVTTPNNRGETMLFHACKSGNLEMAVWLADTAGAANDVNRAANLGDTPLYVAAWSGHLHMVQWLLQRGALKSVSLPNNHHVLPIFAASANGHFEVVKWLVNHGGALQDVSIPTGRGATPMLAACIGGYFPVMNFLYSHGASDDLSKSNDDGESPMYHACEQGRFDVVKWLCQRGASVDLCKSAHNGATPLLRACEGNFLNIVESAIQQGIPEPCASDFPVQHLSSENRRKLYQQAIDVRDVDHVSFLTLTMARRHRRVSLAEVSSRFGVHQLPMDVLQLVGDFVRGTGRTRNLWGRVVSLYDGKCHPCSKQGSDQLSVHVPSAEY